VITCVRSASKCGPRMSGWFPARGDASRVCAARSWRCWRASAQSTTCVWRWAAKNPSPQVVAALAQALRLDINATRYLHQLANPIISRWDHSVLDAAAEGLDELVDQLPFPAIVANRYQDVLAANPIAQALSPGFTPGQNFLRWRLLDPAARELYVDWEDATDAAVSGLRELAGAVPDDLAC
jgi:hypothetical protein